jgi:hypothetical protein
MDIYVELKYLLSKLYHAKEKNKRTTTERYRHSYVNTTRTKYATINVFTNEAARTCKQGRTRKIVSSKTTKIDMISFAGDKTKWIEFWDYFKNKKNIRC